MKRYCISAVISAIFLMIVPITAFPAIGDWKVYMAYSEIQQIEAAGNYLFVRASNSLYLYNKNDQSITTFDRTTGMSDVTINYISWNSTAKRLVVVYDNSNIDLIDTDGNVINISDLYNKSMTEDKTVNSITNYGKYSYLATNFGAIKINVSDAEISESYIFGIQARKVGISGQNIYIRQTNGTVITASLTSSNLQDYSFWSTTTSHPSGIFDEDLTAYNENIELVQTLSPGGPKYNYFYNILYANNRLYTVGGSWTPSIDAMYPGTAQVLNEDGEWHIFQDSLQNITGYQYRDNMCIDYDPTNISRVMVGGRCGLYEFENGVLKQYFNKDNSLLGDVGGFGNSYVFVHGMKFDSNGNLWILNSATQKGSLLEFTKSGEWVDHNFSSLYYSGYSFMNMRNATFDSRGLLWFGNDHYNYPALAYYNPTLDTVKVYSSFINQDGTSISVEAVQCIAEDKSGNIWIGTKKGPLYLTSTDIANGDEVFTQYKVARNDGTNLADYLLSGVNTTAIAIDGGNRKWFGTNGAGLYLISSDNNTQVLNLTKENSNLLSNNINSIAIDGTNGIVYIATDKGLCSYASDASEPNEEMTSDNVYAYPNPVKPEYTGLITITGLSENANVKITTATGYLVAEGTSNGGTFTWDGCDKNGDKVVSGVYNAITAKSDGTKGTVCKIAIIR